ncbi:hypothetical protein OBBRIDRAFT_142879 [Obba rivulosa]|uniref:Uncharacterized protein n=1 Tax=Obba rivulosa TaxID=1052685 RepID=A0A8E2DRH0_9APHY|nr:hypothetical protein OBBRIDRAFT_142879 [Obba rivulosa]
MARSSATAPFSYISDGLGVDWYFGDAVLWNFYSLFGFGSYMASGSGGPFVQLLSLTDANEALAKFDVMSETRISLLE